MKKLLRYLQSHHILTLATVGHDGSPQAAALFYVAGDRGQIYFLSSPTSRHSRNLQVDARVAVTIQGEAQRWQDVRGVQIEGTARVVVTSDEHAEAMRRYLCRFPELQETPASDDDVARAMQSALRQATLYCIDPRWVRWIDNRQGFGHKEAWGSSDQ